MLLRSIRLLVTLVLFLVGLSLLGLPLISQDSPTRVDAIVVIGGDHKPERIAKTAALYAAGYAPKIIISAGTTVQEGGVWMPEAEVMNQQLASHTIPVNAITLEQTSQTTRENALETVPLLKAANTHSILLVTSPFHSRRAHAIFQDVYGDTVRVNIQPAITADFCALCWWFQPDERDVVLSEYWKWLVWLTARR